MTTTRALLATMLGLAACGAEDGVEPAFELGTGEVAYHALAEGGDLEVIYGPQGGYHVLGAFRMVGIEPGNTSDLADASNPTVTFSLVDAGEELSIIGSITQGIKELDGEEPFTHGMLNRFVILDIADDDDIAGHEMTFSVDLVDADGTTWSDSRQVVITKHPANDTVQ